MGTVIQYLWGYRRWPMWGSVLILAVCAWCLTFGPASAQEYPEEPILRLEVGQHTAPIRRIDVDRDERFLVTGSHDKTARVWDVDTGRLLKVLRVPIAPGRAGRVDAVAISPDGRTVAIGGWMTRTALDNVIHLVDRETGRQLGRIEGLPSAVLYLAFSDDGRYLVVTLGGSNGIRVYDTANWSEIAQDEAYGASSFWADFDPRNRLVTTSEDKFVRLYDVSFNLKTKIVGTSGEEPFSAVFSPDGSKIAVGYYNSTRIDVLSGDDLQLLLTPNEPGGYRDLIAVEWSKDGYYLYAAGLVFVPNGDNTIIRRWSRGGQDVPIDFAVPEDTVMGLVALRAGRLAVGAQDPLAAVLDARGQPLWTQERAIADFRDQRGESAIRLSPAGDIVRFGFRSWGRDPAQFSARETLLTRDPTEGGDLTGPVTKTAALYITDWTRSDQPKLNGKVLPVEDFETSRSVAIAPDGRHFLLGTIWRLRYFDAEGNEEWNVGAPGEASTVNIARNGKVAVAGFRDGTLRWYRLSDGEELLALFADPHSDRWIVWTPQGYYHASAGAEDLIGWHVNHGPDQTPDFFPASRFRDQFSRPDVIARVLDTLDVEMALKQADQARGQRTVAKDIRALRPPVISIIAPASGSQLDQARLVMTYQTESPTGPVTGVEARIDGRPAEVIDHHPGAIGQITLAVPPRDSTVSLIARNSNGASEPANFDVNWTGTADFNKPELYVLSVGVSSYDDAGVRDLTYAHQDAADFAAAIKAQKGGLYKDVHTRVLLDEEATRETVLDGMDWLVRESSPRDVAILFISGHGMKDARGRYRFMPHDTNVANLRRTTVKEEDFKEFLGDIAAKTIMFNDTCHSGAVIEGRKADTLPNIDQFANELADAESGVIVFSSSTGRQLSQEGSTWQNGAFTEALIEAVKSRRADFTRDFLVSIAELEEYLGDRVKELTKGAQKPVTTKPKAVENYKIVSLVRN